MFEKGNQLWKKSKRAIGKALLSDEINEENKTASSVAITEPPAHPARIEHFDGLVWLNVRLALTPQSYEYLKTVSEGRSTTYESTISDGIQYLVDNGIL